MAPARFQTAPAENRPDWPNERHRGSDSLGVTFAAGPAWRARMPIGDTVAGDSDVGATDHRRAARSGAVAPRTARAAGGVSGSGGGRADRRYALRRASPRRRRDPRLGTRAPIGAVLAPRLDVRPRRSRVDRHQAPDRALLRPRLFVEHGGVHAPRSRFRPRHRYRGRLRGMGGGGAAGRAGSSSPIVDGDVPQPASRAAGQLEARRAKRSVDSIEVVDEGGTRAPAQ